MQIVRFLLISIVFFNGLAVDPAVQIVPAGTVVPSTVLGIVLGYRVPLGMVTHLIEKYYPLGGQTSDKKEERKERQNISDLCGLQPQGITGGDGGRYHECRSSGDQGIALSGCSEPLFCALAPRYGGRLRSLFFGHSVLTYLVVLALENLPGDRCMNQAFPGYIKGSSGYGWAFSVGIAL